DPKMTRLSRTTSLLSDPKSTDWTPPLRDTPSRHTNPSAALRPRTPAMTGGVPVHSMITSKSPGTASSDALWYVAPSARTISGLGPSLARSKTCTSRPRWRPSSAASNPTGPAPVTSTAWGYHRARRPIRSQCSHAFATTLAGSVSTATRPSDALTGTTNEGSMRQNSEPKPSNDFIPCSVSRPLRHISHSPAAQFAQGTGSGCRTMPITYSPAYTPEPSGASSTTPSDSCPMISRL